MHVMAIKLRSDPSYSLNDLPKRNYEICATSVARTND